MSELIAKMSMPEGKWKRVDYPWDVSCYYGRRGRSDRTGATRGCIHSNLCGMGQGAGGLGSCSVYCWICCCRGVVHSWVAVNALPVGPSSDSLRV